MGHGIAELFAMSGYSVNLIDVSQDALQKALQGIRESLERFVKRGTMTEDSAQGIVSGIRTFTKISEGVSEADLIIEAVPEKLEIKDAVFREISSYARVDAIIGSNTSNIRITELSKSVTNPARFLGVHFFNPPVIMKLVEVIRGEDTSEDVVNTVYEAMKRLGKVPVKVKKDVAGFIVNRISAPEMLYFCLILDKGMAKPEEVDLFAKSQGLPMGPYELMDFVGLDVVYDSMAYYAKEISEDYAKCSTIKQMVEKGMLGRKAGRGFYQWSSGKAIIGSASPTDKVTLLDVLVLEVNEAVKLIELGVASPDDIETAVKLGLNRPFGPISVAQSITSSEAREKLDKISKEFQCSVFEPAASIRDGKLRDAIEGKLKPAEETVPAAQQPAGYKVINVEKVADRIAKISINRPKLNLLSVDVINELDRAIDELWNDRETFVILITGSGANFSAGADLSTYFADATSFMEFSRKGERVFRKLTEIPKVVIASLKGYVLGGGLELALACDIRVSTSSSTIGFPEVTLGLVPGWGGTQRLTRLVGASRAMRMILTGERITGKDAYDMGLVAKLFDGDIDAEALKYAQGIASSSAPIAAALAKKLINKAAEVPEDVGLDLESTAMGVLYGTEDLKEGVSSLLSKTKPVYRGK
ncbi:MAG: 3-hydroxyacyl-CoA dehydrogenase/enoyl-CoA hydratase family protein [Thaumarchaeota archaeon]|nr:3-hydroxyacyl-CoA dehydrogenase/enoyl-CoA hydratase family protein [Nitrososphaerota archaeon]